MYHCDNILIEILLVGITFPEVRNLVITWH